MRACAPEYGPRLACRWYSGLALIDPTNSDRLGIGSLRDIVKPDSWAIDVSGSRL